MQELNVPEGLPEGGISVKAPQVEADTQGADLEGDFSGVDNRAC